MTAHSKQAPQLKLIFHLFVGLPGSGKATWARLVFDESNEESTEFESVAIWGGGITPRARRYEKIESLKEAGKSVFYYCDEGNGSRTALEEILGFARSLSFDIHVYESTTTLAFCFLCGVQGQIKQGIPDRLHTAKEYNDLYATRAVFDIDEVLHIGETLRRSSIEVRMKDADLRGLLKFASGKNVGFGKINCPLADRAADLMRAELCEARLSNLERPALLALVQNFFDRSRPR